MVSWILAFFILHGLDFILDHKLRVPLWGWVGAIRLFTVALWTGTVMFINFCFLWIITRIHLLVGACPNTCLLLSCWWLWFGFLYWWKPYFDTFQIIYCLHPFLPRLWLQRDWGMITLCVLRGSLKMEGLIALQHRLLHSVNWHLQLKTLERNVF